MEIKMNILNFDENILNKTLLLFFEGEDCGLCEGMKRKTLSELKEFDVDICFVSLKEYSELRGRFQVFSFPTLLLLQNGRELERVAGFFDLTLLKRKLYFMKQ